MARIHAGLWTDCKNCNPDWKPKKRDRKDVKPKYTSGQVSVDIAIRRQVAADLGDEEPNKDEKFALLQKYGAAAPRIDRNVTMPTWQEEGVWKSMKGQFDKTVKGLVPREQERRTYPARGISNSVPNTKSNHHKWATIRFKNPQAQAKHEQKYWGLKDSNSSRSSRPSRPNSNPTRTGTPQK